MRDLGLPKLFSQELLALKHQHDGPLNLYIALSLICPALVALTALLAPMDILQQSPSLAAFCAWMVEHFPFLARHAPRSSFPGPTLLVKCLSFASLPAVLVTGWWIGWSQRHVVVKRTLYRVLKPQSVFLFLGITLFLAPVSVGGLWFIPGDPSFAKGLTTQSRVGMAFIEFAVLGGIGWILPLPITFAYVNYHVSKFTKISGRTK
jgi:hypothetical protein